jgi:GNAT superfamily N-acetyltransferase
LHSIGREVLKGIGRLESHQALLTVIMRANRRANILNMEVSILRVTTRLTKLLEGRGKESNRYFLTSDGTIFGKYDAKRARMAKFEIILETAVGSASGSKDCIDLALPTAVFGIVTHLDETQAKSLHELFQNEWWTKDRTFEEVQHLLAHSLSVAIVEISTQALVAYSRVVTDRLRFAHICDVIVNQAFRGKKLGKTLLEAILNHSELKKVTSFELKCLPELVPFYEKCGFTVPSKEYVLMAHKR